ncbi:hypothetical protein LWI28_022598 [Acer negundo]|uniref:Uncharacterized protein n=1 Tax=Acer negundo TaxID=4023 RepID=A0AAD5P1J4_ACENE|nr:hypothetical protein LWI28_022598 [Acer negundo]
MAAQHTDTGANRGFKGRKPSNLSDERGIELARKVSGVQSEFQSKCSFVDVVDGKSGHVSEVEEKAVTFHWKGHKGEGVWRRKCAIGVLKQFSSIRSANDRLEEKDFPFSSTFGSTQDNRLSDGYNEGLLLSLGEKESAEIREINLSVVLPTPPPRSKLKSFKSKSVVSKMHVMKTRRDKKKEQEVNTENKCEIYKLKRESGKFVHGYSLKDPKGILVVNVELQSFVNCIGRMLEINGC